MRLDDELAPGAFVLGKYRVDMLLGRGGMGCVYRARHVALGRRVALKVLHEGLTTNGDLRRRFAREAAAVSQLESEHVARVLDYETLHDGRPVIVLEHLEGSDLAWVRGEGRPLPPELAIEYLIQACEGVAAAHARGIVHRDIKPANLFLARVENSRPRIKVLDFGIAKVPPRPGDEKDRTRGSLALGTLEYMSPEQIASTRDVDARTDIWALGVTLFELVTARVPFTGHNLTQIATDVIARPTPSVRALCGSAPPRLEAVIRRCLEKRPEHRYPSAHALASELRAVQAELRREGATAGSISGQPESLRAVVSDVPPRRPGLASAILATALVAFGAGVALPRVSSAVSAELRDRAPAREPAEDFGDVGVARPIEPAQSLFGSAAQEVPVRQSSATASVASGPQPATATAFPAQAKRRPMSAIQAPSSSVAQAAPTATPKGCAPGLFFCPAAP